MKFFSYLFGGPSPREVAIGGGISVFHEIAKVVFSVTGPAELVGVDNGDLCSSEPYDNSAMQMYHGCVSPVIRLTGEKERVVLSAVSEGMYPARLVINVI